VCVCTSLLPSTPVLEAEPKKKAVSEGERGALEPELTRKIISSRLSRSLLPEEATTCQMLIKQAAQHPSPLNTLQFRTSSPKSRVNERINHFPPVGRSVWVLHLPTSAHGKSLPRGSVVLINCHILGFIRNRLCSAISDFGISVSTGKSFSALPLASPTFLLSPENNVRLAMQRHRTPLLSSLREKGRE